MSIEPWSLIEKLPEKTAAHLQFSRGFLRGQATQWFPNLASQWLPLFHLLGLETVTGVKISPKLVFATPRLDFPSSLSRLTVIEVDGEWALFGFDDHALDNLSGLIAPALPEISGDIFLEYLERRLCSTLQAAWADDEPLLVQYLPQTASEDVDIIGALQVRLQFGEVMFDVWFGCGSRLTERLDYFSRKRLPTTHGDDLGDQVRTISVELAELWVPPALLIDYMRSGTTIDLERPSTPEVRLLLDGVVWASGTLCICEETLAVEIQDLNIASSDVIEGSTRVSVVLSTTQVDLPLLREYEQPGALLSLDMESQTSAQIVIGGETVASAEIGEVDGRLAVQVQSMR